ncbi:MAG: DUF1080 domain-containing protein [Pirellulales bacterium]
MQFLGRSLSPRLMLGTVVLTMVAAAASAADNTPPEGFVALFNGRDLTGWKGLVKTDNPFKRAALTSAALEAEQEAADELMKEHWSVEDGALVYDGHGRSLCTVKDYGDFELYVDWKIGPGGDSGIYLRGTPQVQIWDKDQGLGKGVGSGGLFNNKKHPSKPLVVADHAAGEWNTFFIRMVGDKVTVKLNGKLVVDNVVLDNYWDYDKPIFPTGQIELQHHGDKLWFKNIYLRELKP